MEKKALFFVHSRLLHDGTVQCDVDMHWNR